MENLLPIRQIPTWKFILYQIITFGLYTYIWLYDVFEDINKLEIKHTEKYNFWLWVPVIFFANLLYIYEAYKHFGKPGTEFMQILSGFTTAWVFLMILSIIKKIENYAYQKYNVIIKHNIIFLILFNVIYLNFAFNSFSSRVQKVIEKESNNK